MGFIYGRTADFLDGLLHRHIPKNLHRFAKASFWSLLSSVIGSGGTLLMYLLVARIIGKGDYGAFVLAQSTLGTVGILAALGMSLAASKYAAELRRKDPARLGRILALCFMVILSLGLILSVAVALFSGQIAVHVFGNIQIAPVLLYSSLWILFSALDGYAKGVMLGFEENRKFATSTIVAMIISFPTLVGLASLYGLNGTAGGLSLIGGLQAAISIALLARVLKQQDVPLMVKGCLVEVALLGHTALPILASSLLFTPVHLITQSMLSRSDAGLEQVAYFGIGQQWITLLLFLPSALSRIAGPILINQISDADHKRARETFRHSVVINIIVCLPLATVLIFFSREIMSMYGGSYREGAATLSLAFVVAAIMSAQAPIANLVAARSKFWVGFAMNGAWAAVYIVLASFLVQYGSFGIMSALLGSYVIHSVWSYLFVKRHL